MGDSIDEESRRSLTCWKRQYLSREEDRHALRAASLAYIFHVYVHDYQSSKDSPWDNLERFFVGFKIKLKEKWT